MRLIIIVIGIALIYFVLKSYFRNMQRPAQPPRTQQPTQGEDMVRCVVCGVNTPRSEAIYSQGEHFCCEEHRRSRHK